MDNEFRLVKLLNEIVRVDVPIRFRGEYDPATEYLVGDIVTYQGGAYIALTTVQGEDPLNSSKWQVLFNAPNIGTIASGSIDQASTLVSAYNCNVTNPSTGNYEVTFFTPADNPFYPVMFGQEGSNLNDFEVKYTNRTVNGFSVNITDQDDGGAAGTPVNRGFSFYVPNLNNVTVPMNDFDFEFIQSTPATTWTINHNLGRIPICELYTTGGVQFDAQVTHTSINQAIVSLNVALAGRARLV